MAKVCCPASPEAGLALAFSIFCAFETSWQNNLHSSLHGKEPVEPASPEAGLVLGILHSLCLGAFVAIICLWGEINISTCGLVSKGEKTKLSFST
jgi:hypothetical protein